MGGPDQGGGGVELVSATLTAPLSQDLRRRIVRAVEGGSSIRRAAARYEVSPSAAVKLMRRVRETGSTAPARIGGHRRPVLDFTPMWCGRWSRRQRTSPSPRSGANCISGTSSYALSTMPRLFVGGEDGSKLTF